MQNREWNFIDKTDWPRGEWDTEPDKMQWTDEATGLPCLIRRSPGSGAWCGYVGVDKGHSLYGKRKSGCDDLYDLDVHGEITYSEFCDGDKEHGICHAVEDDDAATWWIGFDCCHLYDRMPQMEASSKLAFPSFRRLSEDSEYRNLAYVKAECTKLAAQLKAL